MISKVKVAGIGIHINASDSFQRNQNVIKFADEESMEEDLRVTLLQCKKITMPDHGLMAEEFFQWANHKEKDEITISIYAPEIRKVNFQLRVNKSWNHAAILSRYKNPRRSFLGTMGELLFRNCLLFHQGFVIHGAAIEWQGKGIIFSAPSGTGKTTQANLWIKYKGAAMINGDRPAIRVLNCHPYVYGTLWNGSSPECKNTARPLSAVIILEQASFNHIVRLRESEAAARIMPRCFLPYYQAEIMGMAINNVEKLLGVTPVYLLKCRPDREAVEIACQCLK